MGSQFHTICPQISFTSRLATGFGGQSCCQGSGIFCMEFNRRVTPVNSMAGSRHREVDRPGWLPARDVLELPSWKHGKPSGAGLCLRAGQAMSDCSMGERGHGQQRREERLCQHSPQREHSLFLGEHRPYIYFQTATALPFLSPPGSYHSNKNLNHKVKTWRLFFFFL